MPMSLNEIAISAAALLPAVVLCIYIYKKDRAEKEPKGLLLLLFGLGAVTCFPAGLYENTFGGALEKIFSHFIYEFNGELYLDTVPYYLYHIINNFFIIALAEEGFKWLVVWIVTHKNKNFNSLFDGIIYCIFTSLGFAAWENIQYGLSYGWSTVVMRMVTSVPGHMFFAVFMGYFYTLWHAENNAKKLEKRLIDSEFLPRRAGSAFSPSRRLAMSLIAPILAHGLYDYCLSLNSTFSTILFYVLLIGAYIFCFMRISKMSQKDKLDYGAAIDLLVEAYPPYKTAVYSALAQPAGTQPAPTGYGQYGQTRTAPGAYPSATRTGTPSYGSTPSYQSPTRTQSAGTPAQSRPAASRPAIDADTLAELLRKYKENNGN